MAVAAAVKKLGNITSMAFEDADAKYKLSRHNRDWNIEDITGTEPDTVYVRKGNAKIAGDVDLTKGVRDSVVVIDGDLTVGGALTLDSEAGNIFYVTGSVRAKTLVVSSSVHLWVDGDLQISGLLVDELSDGGGLYVRGSTKAQAIVVGGSGESRHLAKGKKVRAIDRDELPDLYAGMDDRTFRKTILNGVDVTVEPPAPKIPTPKNLKPGEWRTKGPDITKMKPAAVYAKIPFKPIAFAEAMKRFKLKARDYLEGVPTPKPVFAVGGDVHLAELRVDTDGDDALYVIDGDLLVDGGLFCTLPEGVLFVTGNVRARDVIVTRGHLHVRGDLDASGTVLAAWQLEVAGTLRANPLVTKFIMPELTRAPVGRVVIEGSYKPAKMGEAEPPPHLQGLKTIPFSKGLKSRFVKKDMHELAAQMVKGVSIVR